jgi:putative acyl-CoA dehydrogenase
MSTPTRPSATHEVVNQSVPFEDVNLFDADQPLREALDREGGAWAVDRARDAGAVAGSAEAVAHGRRALRAPDRRGGARPELALAAARRRRA